MQQPRAGSLVLVQRPRLRQRKQPERRIGRASLVLTLGGEERTLRPEDLYSADELFISSTNRSLLGVGELSGHTFSAPGPITRKLEQVFSAYIATYVAAHSTATAK